MNINSTFSPPLRSPPVNDDRIYNDWKDRPVGLAGRVNRVTSSIEKPTVIPLMTPEDKRYFDACFERCVNTASRFIRSQQ